MQAIEVSHLTKKFGSLTALNNISFSVGEGETFGFLGPNGAGKTTTIRILTGVSRPSSGTASIFGHDIEHDKIGARQSMGIVSENSNVYDDLTAWQNMMFSAELYHVGRKEREEKATELLRKFELYDRRDDKVRGFSKGMKRRLTLSMGLVNSPRLLFLDEPTSGLDVQSNLIIRDVVSDLVLEGVTVFLTTHNMRRQMSCVIGWRLSIKETSLQ
jgi:ABC-2 type transport system ATP-binding protein